MWIFRPCDYEKFEIGYYIMNVNADTSGFRCIFTVNSKLDAVRLVNYLNGGDGTISSGVEDICNEERT